jgi:beta-glucoside operon transcriptional antiterminator
MTKMIQGILSIVKYYYKMNINEDSLYYERFVTHLKFFSQRNLIKMNEPEKEEELYEMVKKQYADAYKCAEKIKSFIEKEYSIKVPEDEMMYLTIHIKRITTP